MRDRIENDWSYVSNWEDSAGNQSSIEEEREEEDEDLYI